LACLSPFSPRGEKGRRRLTTFPGEDRIVIYFEDTKKRAGAPCLLHEALLDKLREMPGKRNFVEK
jgi:DNA polymerase-3 subunit alpha